MQRRTIALLLGAALTTGMCLAQQADPSQSAAPSAAQSTQTMAPRHQMNPDKQAKHLGKQLGLSRDQVTQIQPILADRQQQMQALRADASMSAQDRRSKAKAIQQDSKAKIEAVLNDTQKQQYEQMLTERRAHRKGQQGTQPQAQPGV